MRERGSRMNICREAFAELVQLTRGKSGTPKSMADVTKMLRMASFYWPYDSRSCC
jgi:hypothetical protein